MLKRLGECLDILHSITCCIIIYNFTVKLQIEISNYYLPRNNRLSITSRYFSSVQLKKKKTMFECRFLTYVNTYINKLSNKNNKNKN